MKIGLLVFVLTLPLGFAQMNHSMDSTVMENDLADLNGEAFEIAFMSGMIAHHEAAVGMAQWILDRTELPGVAASAQQIKAAQEPEITLMQSWLDDWYGGKTDAAAAAMMQGDMDAMTASLDTYDNADTAFLTEMSLHHNGAIDMAQLALTKAVHPKLRELAKDIIRNQAQEIADYQEVLAELASR
ncbi:hypothetical protein BH24DEI2_BH24DEI2_27830 [soil metagenome]